MAERRTFSLTSFFEGHSNLFVVISVFSGLLVFFTDLISKNPEGGIIEIGVLQIKPLEYAIVACYIIVLTVALLLLYKLFHDDGLSFPLDYIITPDAIKRIWLAVPLLILFLAGGAYVIRTYPSILRSFVFVFALLFGFIAWGLSLMSWTNFVDKHTKYKGRGYPSLLVYSFILLILVGISMVFIEPYQYIATYGDYYLAVKLFLGIIGPAAVIGFFIAALGCLYLAVRFIFRIVLEVSRKLSRHFKPKKV